MMTEVNVVDAGRQLNRAFALLDRSNEIHLPTTPAVLTRRGLLDEARRAVEAARAALE